MSYYAILLLYSIIIITSLSFFNQPTVPELFKVMPDLKLEQVWNSWSRCSSCCQTIIVKAVLKDEGLFV